MDKDKYLEWKLREKLLAMIDASNLIKSVDDLQFLKTMFAQETERCLMNTVNSIPVWKKKKKSSRLKPRRMRL